MSTSAAAGAAEKPAPGVGGAAQRGPLLRLTQAKFNEVGKNAVLAMSVIEAFKDCDASIPVLPRMCMGGAYLFSALSCISTKADTCAFLTEAHPAAFITTPDFVRGCVKLGFMYPHYAAFLESDSSNPANPAYTVRGPLRLNVQTEFEEIDTNKPLSKVQSMAIMVVHIVANAILVMPDLFDVFAIEQNGLPLFMALMDSDPSAEWISDMLLCTICGIVKKFCWDANFKKIILKSGMAESTLRLTYSGCLEVRGKALHLSVVLLDGMKAKYVRKNLAGYANATHALIQILTDTTIHESTHALAVKLLHKITVVSEDLRDVLLQPPLFSQLLDFFLRVSDESVTPCDINTNSVWKLAMHCGGIIANIGFHSSDRQQKIFEAAPQLIPRIFSTLHRSGAQNFCRFNDTMMSSLFM